MTTISIPSIIAASFVASNVAYPDPVQSQRRELSTRNTMTQASTNIV